MEREILFRVGRSAVLTQVLENGRVVVEQTYYKTSETRYDCYDTQVDEYLEKIDDYFIDFLSSCDLIGLSQLLDEFSKKGVAP